MANLPKGIVVGDGGLDFGDYTVTEKIKVNDFEDMGNVYSLRAHDKVTRLEKNGELLFEAVPGAAVCNFAFDEAGCSFEITSSANVQVTLGMAPEAAYDLAVGNVKGAETHEEIKASRAGKLSFWVELEGAGKKVVLSKL